MPVPHNHQPISSPLSTMHTGPVLSAENDPLLQTLFAPDHSSSSLGNNPLIPNPQQFMTTDPFIKALFGTDFILPIDLHSPNNTLEQTHSNEYQPQGALISLPLDQSSSIWTSFAEGDNWMTREPDEGEDEPLLEYFMKIASTTVVVRGSPTPTGKFFTDLAEMASTNSHSALMHAVLCVSAQHLANWSQKAGDVAKAVTFGDSACRHKLEAISLLRRSNDETDGLSPAVMVMLNLSALLKGESDIIPSFLNRTTYLLGKVQKPSSYSFLPSIAAVHAAHVGFYSLSLAEQTDVTDLFKSWDDSSNWQQQAEDVCVFMFGVAASLTRTAEISPSNMNMNMAQLELEAEASDIRTELRNDVLFEAKYKIGTSGIGNEFYRLAVIIIILTSVFLIPSGHSRLHRCVDDLLKISQGYSLGMEIGLCWPLIIVASEAGSHQRSGCISLIQKFQWKGSSGPQWVETVVTEVWKARDAVEIKTWRDIVVAAGSPLII
uniref:Uncharacterized protein n=1 Tax=Kwoniella dejecticola CBS 10117 TaxID=1296121 RepID=A0A1A6A8M7_9TREE|nr:uncharacterized protein I303_02418 [Kwoniella dejecticola CBS 10117]OBR86411.1 hypothetical protein I303_02418 [Kwoniella dejecticola CBS 10117]